MKNKPTIITASSLACLMTCARKYYLSYVEGWRKATPDGALRFGTAFHKGLEVWFAHHGTEQTARAQAALISAFETAGDEAFDAETAAQLTALLGGYFKRWGNEPFTVEPEKEFAVRFPFLRGVVFCGKMDGIVKFANGRLGIIEHKTTSEDISLMSDYWQTINKDQIGLYKAASEKEGTPIATVVYDVIRKPTIKCGANETPEEYGTRLAADCVGAQEGDNPRQKGYKRGADFYFARREIPLLDCDANALARRCYAAVKMIRTYRKLAKTFVADGAEGIEAWPKCGSALTCKACPFRGGLCNSSEMPECWERGRAHEELEIAKKFM